MSIIDAFDGGQEKQNKSHIRNLIRIGMADGHFEQEETQKIYRIARHLGVTQEEVDQLIADPNQIGFIAPSNIEERLERFVNLLRVILADGMVTDEERRLLRRLGVGLDIDLDKIDAMAEKGIAMIKAGDDVDDIILSLRKF